MLRVAVVDVAGLIAPPGDDGRSVSCWCRREEGACEEKNDGLRLAVPEVARLVLVEEGGERGVEGEELRDGRQAGEEEESREGDGRVGGELVRVVGERDRRGLARGERGRVGEERLVVGEGRREAAAKSVSLGLLESFRRQREEDVLDAQVVDVGVKAVAKERRNELLNLTIVLAARRVQVLGSCRAVERLERDEPRPAQRARQLQDEVLGRASC